MIGGDGVEEMRVTRKTDANETAHMMLVTMATANSIIHTPSRRNLHTLDFCPAREDPILQTLSPQLRIFLEGNPKRNEGGVEDQLLPSAFYIVKPRAPTSRPSENPACR